MPLDQVQVAILTLLRGKRPVLRLRVNPAQLAARGVRRLELLARGVTLAAELCIAVVATGVAIDALVTTPNPNYSIDAQGLQRLAALAATGAFIAGSGVAAAVRWRRWFWRIQLIVGCGLAAWYLALRAV